MFTLVLIAETAKCFKKNFAHFFICKIKTAMKNSEKMEKNFYSIIYHFSQFLHHSKKKVYLESSTSAQTMKMIIGEYEFEVFDNRFANFFKLGHL